MAANDLRQKGYIIEVLLERGRERFRRGASTVALQLWEEALAVDPEEPRALSYIDYVRQNWDEVDGAIDAPLPDVSDLKPNYPVEHEPGAPPVGNVQAPVAGQVDTREIEKRRGELAALEAQIAAARAEAERLAAAPPPAAAAPSTSAVPDPIHDASTPRGTVELLPGGVAGDGWSVAAEPVTRDPAALAALRPWHAEPVPAAELAAASTASEIAAPEPPLAEGSAIEVPASPVPATSGQSAPAAAHEAAAIEGHGASEPEAGGSEVLGLGVSLTDAAMAPAIGPFGSSEDAVTHPRIRLLSESELDALSDQATKLYPRRSTSDALAAASASALGPAPVAHTGLPAATPTEAEDEDAVVARTPTPVMAGRTTTPLIPGRTIVGAPDGLLPVPDADFERDLEAALGAAAVSPEERASTAPIVHGADDDAVPAPLGGLDLDEDLDLDLPPPVAEVVPAEPLLAADLPVPAEVVPPIAGAGPEPAGSGPPSAATASALVDEPAPLAPATSDPFAEDRPTVWSPPPAMPAPAAMSLAERVEQALSLADRVEQAMARDDAFGDSVTTSWQAPPAELLEASRRPDAPPPPAWVQPYSPPEAPAGPAAATPAAGPAHDAAAELAAQLINEPLPPAREPEPATVQLQRLAAMPPAPSEVEGSVFDRVTTQLPVTRDEDEAPAPRLTTPMAAARTTVTMSAAEQPASELAATVDGEPPFDDIELAPRSGVGLGAEPPVRLDVRELTTTIDDLGPLARSTGRPSSPSVAVPPELEAAPPAPPHDELPVGARPGTEEVALDESDLIPEDELAPAPPPARVSTLPLVPVAEAQDAAGAASRTSTLDLRAGVPDEAPAAPPADLGLPISPSSEVRLPRTTTAERAAAAFDGPEAQTVTVAPPSLDLVAASGAGSVRLGSPVELADEDPFELPTAPVSPLPEPPPVRIPDSAADEQPAGGPRAKTLEFLPAGASSRWSAGALTGRDNYQADTAELTPRVPTADDVNAPASGRTPTPSSRDKIDTVDLGPSRATWQQTDEPTGEPAAAPPSWPPPPLEPAPAWAAPPPPPPPAPGHAPATIEPIELPAPQRTRTPTPRTPVEGLRRGDEIWGRDEHLGARLSPEVLRGLGLTPVAPPPTDEPTRDGWPVGRRPAPPPRAAESRTRTGGDAAAGAPPDGAPPPPSPATDLGLDDLELPSPTPGGATRTPGEVLLRSSAPEALAAALASELDRGAPAQESPDERARRRITALLEKASAAARAGEHPLSIAAIDLALSEAPDSAVAQKLVHRSRDIILDCYTRYFGDLSRRPVPVGSLSDLTGRALDPRAAFLVSRMDGTLTYEEILDVAGMGRLEACRHLAQLLVRGIIRAS